MKNKERHWPCGCVTFTKGKTFYIRPCSPHCEVLRTVIEVSEEKGNIIEFRKEGEDSD